MKQINKIKKEITKFIKKVNSMWDSFLNLKVIRKIFLFLPHNFFLFLLFLMSVALIIKFNYNRFIPLYTHQLVADAAFEPILDSSLTFSLKNVKPENIKENPQDICMMFSTYTRKTNSIYKYIVHKNNTILYEEEFNSKILEDGRFSCFSLPDATIETIQEYEIEIAPIKTDEKNIISVFKNQDTNEAVFKLSKEQPFFATKTIVIGGFFLLFFALNYCINTKKWSIEKIWLLFAFLYVLPITIITPPYEVPDEPIHFYSAYRLTQGDKNKNFYENLESMEMVMPENIDCIGYVGIQTRDKVVDMNDIQECLKNTPNKEKRSIFSYVSTKIAFFASALGIKIADIFTNSPVIIFYMGRIFNALLSIFILYKALKIAPKHKELLLLWITIPMFIQQMGSYSYDSLLNTMSVLATAIMFKFIYEKNVNKKLYTCLLLLCGLFIANIKLLYLPIFLMLLFVPSHSNKQKYMYCLAIILCSYLLSGFVNGLFTAGGILLALENLLAAIAIGCIVYQQWEDKRNKIWLIFYGVLNFILLVLNPKCLLFTLPFLFFIPKYQWVPKHKKAICIVSIIAVLGAIVFLPKIATPFLCNYLGDTICPKAMDILYHPFQFLLLLLRTIKFNFWFYATSIVGFFGWFTFRLNNIYVYAYVIILLYVLMHSHFNKIKWWDRIICLLGILLGIVAVFLAMYFYWPSASTYFIDGVQGRYFLPFVVPLLTLFLPTKKKVKEKNVSFNTYSFINIILLEFVCLLLIFYY